MKKNYETACGFASFLLLFVLITYTLFHLQTWAGFLDSAFAGLARHLPWK